MDSLAFLEHRTGAEPRSVYVLPGDEEFLKRRVVAALRERILGADADAFGLSTYSGDKAEFSSVRSELETLPFLSPRRLVVIANADPFVTKNRAALERYVSQPASTGVLVLLVTSWPSNTRLAKMLDDEATIVCKALPPRRLPEWCVHWAATEHDKPLATPAATLLVELVGSDMGLLDQELAKLAIYVGDAKRIESRDVDQLVGSSRTESTWKIFDALAGGQLAEALAILDRLLDQGEEPMRLLGAFSMQLRRLAQAYQLNQQGAPLASALEQVGILPFAIRGAEQQLRHLGRRRAERLYDWLLEIDLGLKGSSQLPPRTLLERFLVQLGRKA